MGSRSKSYSNRRDGLILKLAWGRAWFPGSFLKSFRPDNIELCSDNATLLARERSSKTYRLGRSFHSVALREKIKTPPANTHTSTSVLISPETALHTKLLPILHDEQFFYRLALVGIRELHVIEQSGKLQRLSSRLFAAEILRVLSIVSIAANHQKQERTTFVLFCLRLSKLFSIFHLRSSPYSNWR